MQSTALAKNLPILTLHFLLWLTVVGSGASALTCFETNDDGDMVEVTNDDYKYCMLMPERIDSNNFMEGKAFGVGPDNDVTSTYDKIFAVNKESDVYQILSMCIYEKFDFAKMSPKFTFKAPEFMLRCFCNFDRCNRDKNFFGYINNLKADSATLETKPARR